MLQRIEMDEHVPLADQLANEVGPVTLINTFKVAPEDADTSWRPGPPMPPTSRPSQASSPPSSTGASPAAGCSSTRRSGSRPRPSATPSGIRSSRRPSPAIRTRPWPHRICFRRWPCPASAWTASSSPPGPVAADDRGHYQVGVVGLAAGVRRTPGHGEERAGSAMSSHTSDQGPGQPSLCRAPAGLAGDRGAGPGAPGGRAAAGGGLAERTDPGRGWWPGAWWPRCRAACSRCCSSCAGCAAAG
jgi:hypothetical protein